MNREEALVEFLKGIRIALSNALAYPKDHPYFKESVEAFRQKLESLFDFLNPVVVGVTPNSIFLDGKYWDKGVVYPELAKILHFRKIKGIEIKKGVTTEELVELLAAAAMPVREILKAGGVNKILSTQKPCPNILVYELDYSELLKSRAAGKGDVDVWGYLLKEALNTNDTAAVEDVFADFIGISEGVELEKLTGDKELLSNINDLIAYIKNNRPEKSIELSRALLNVALKAKDSLNDDNINKMKELFKSLSSADLAGLLWNKALYDENFDAYGLSIFSRIAGLDRKEEVESALKENAPKRVIDPKAQGRIGELLKSGDTKSASEPYRHALSLLSKDIAFTGEASFDRKALRDDYRLILLNILALERGKDNLPLILKSIEGELAQAIKDRDIIYCKYLTDLLAEKAKEFPGSAETFSGPLNTISEFVESAIWDNIRSPELDSLIMNLDKSALRPEFYLGRIFGEGKVSPCALKLFFRFFPDKLEAFYEGLDSKIYDFEFASRLIGGLKEVDSPVSMDVLKHIFSSQSEFMQIMAVEAMEGHSRLDEEFLFPLLMEENFGLRRSAFLVLKNNAQTLARALREFFEIKKTFWAGNKIILENMDIVGQLGVKEASRYLEGFSRKPFFWNSSLRKKAREILREWNVKKH